jgi:hypothetical protein
MPTLQESEFEAITKFMKKYHIWCNSRSENYLLFSSIRRCKSIDALKLYVKNSHSFQWEDVKINDKDRGYVYRISLKSVIIADST